MFWLERVEDSMDISMNDPGRKRHQEAKNKITANAGMLCKAAQGRSKKW